MTVFRIFLLLILASLLAYTGAVIAHHGFGLFAVFFGDILKVGWPGQFNLDFLFMLTLSAAWTVWRNRFSRNGIVLALLALLGGSLFLAVYLLVLIWQTKGDIKRILLGNEPVA